MKAPFKVGDIVKFKTSLINEVYLICEEDCFDPHDFFDSRASNYKIILLYTTAKHKKRYQFVILNKHHINNVCETIIE